MTSLWAASLPPHPHPTLLHLLIFPSLYLPSNYKLHLVFLSSSLSVSLSLHLPSQKLSRLFFYQAPIYHNLSICLICAYLSVCACREPHNRAINKVLEILNNIIEYFKILHRSRILTAAPPPPPPCPHPCLHPCPPPCFALYHFSS